MEVGRKPSKENKTSDKTLDHTYVLEGQGKEKKIAPKVPNQFVFLKSLYVCMFRNKSMKGKRKELEKSYFVLLFLGMMTHRIMLSRTHFLSIFT